MQTPRELEKFGEPWPTAGGIRTREFKPLHDINPLRLGWIDRIIGLAGKRVSTSAAAVAS